MRITYDPLVDALAVELTTNGRSVRMQKLAPGINLDWHKEGRLITIEMLDSSARYPRSELEQLDDGTEWKFLGTPCEADITDLVTALKKEPRATPRGVGRP